MATAAHHPRCAAVYVVVTVWELGDYSLVKRTGTEE